MKSPCWPVWQLSAALDPAQGANRRDSLIARTIRYNGVLAMERAGIRVFSSLLDVKMQGKAG